MGTTDLLSNHLLSTNECNEFNHRGKENGTDLLRDHTISVAKLLLPLRGGDQIAFPIMKLEQEILLYPCYMGLTVTTEKAVNSCC